MGSVMTVVQAQHRPSRFLSKDDSDGPRQVESSPEVDEEAEWAMDMEAQGEQQFNGQGSSYFDGFCKSKFFSGSYCLGKRYVVHCQGGRATGQEQCTWHNPCREGSSKLKRLSSCGAGDAFCKDKFFSGSYCDGDHTLVVCRGQQLQKRTTCPWHAPCVQEGSRVSKYAGCGVSENFCRSKFWSGSYCHNNMVVVCDNKRITQKFSCYHSNCKEEGSTFH